MKIKHIVKRDFQTKPFYQEKITNAILKAMTAVEHGGPEDAERISNLVNEELEKRKDLDNGYIEMNKLKNVRQIFLRSVYI